MSTVSCVTLLQARSPWTSKTPRICPVDIRTSLLKRCSPGISIPSSFQTKFTFTKFTLPFPITYSILNALLTALLPTFPRKLPPPLTMPIVFTDAAQVPFSPYYRVHPHTYATATLAPAWVRTQQQAELYGAFHGIRQAILRGLCYLCLVTDNSGVYCTLKYGKISARCPTRLRILRRIYRLLYQSQCKIQLLLIPLSKNIADPFSRGLLQPPLPHSVYDNTVPYIRYCHTPTRLWCHWSLFHLPLFSLSPMLQLKPTRFGVW